MTMEFLVDTYDAESVLGVGHHIMKTAFVTTFGIAK
jgi:hypothetical protein